MRGWHVASLSSYWYRTTYRNTHRNTHRDEDAWLARDFSFLVLVLPLLACLKPVCERVFVCMCVCVMCVCVMCVCVCV